MTEWQELARTNDRERRFFKGDKLVKAVRGQGLWTLKRPGGEDLPLTPNGCRYCCEEHSVDRDMGYVLNMAERDGHI